MNILKFFIGFIVIGWLLGMFHQVLTPLPPGTKYSTEWYIIAPHALLTDTPNRAWGIERVAHIGPESMSGTEWEGGGEVYIEPKQQTIELKVFLVIAMVGYKEGQWRYIEDWTTYDSNEYRCATYIVFYKGKVGYLSGAGCRILMCYLKRIVPVDWHSMYDTSKTLEQVRAYCETRERLHHDVEVPLLPLEKTNDTFQSWLDKMWINTFGRPQ